MSKVYFVGCGPGDPDLITVKAKKLLQKANVVVYSGSLIPDQILKICKKAKMHDAAGLVREEIFEILKNGAIQGKLTIRLHDGDPADPRQGDGVLRRDRVGARHVPALGQQSPAAARHRPRVPPPAGRRRSGPRSRRAGRRGRGG